LRVQLIDVARYEETYFGHRVLAIMNGVTRESFRPNSCPDRPACSGQTTARQL
jgi:hypothetical protein